MREIAKEVTETTDPLKFRKLSEELNEALELQETSSGDPYLRFKASAWVSDVLVSSIAAGDAACGNIQLIDEAEGVLRIVAQYGFDSEFLNYFQNVAPHDNCACGRAMNKRSRAMVTDVGHRPGLG